VKAGLTGFSCSHYCRTVTLYSQTTPNFQLSVSHRTKACGRQHLVFSSVTVGFSVAFLDENGMKTTTFRTATTLARYYSTSATSTSISSTTTSTSTSDHQYLAHSHYVYLMASSKPLLLACVAVSCPEMRTVEGQ
jgi:hypothetical protein